MQDHTAQTESNLPRVDVRSLTKLFSGPGGRSVRALAGVDLQVHEGELLVLLGPSGCGKSTLLRCIAGLEHPTSGSITLGTDLASTGEAGHHLPAHKRDVGMVFQGFSLWPHMTVERNVRFPLQAKHMKDELSAGRVDEVLRVVQCEHLKDRYPGQLSGGQQQRVALARALAARPAVMLLDEPLSNLDALLRIELRAALRQIHRRLGFTGIFVTHDQTEALNLASRVAIMNDGRIEQIGAPDTVYQRPATEYAAEFLGARNKLVGSVDSGRRFVAEDGQPLLNAEAPARSNNAITIRLRPEDISLCSPLIRGDRKGQARLDRGVVIERLPAGRAVDYVVDVGGTPMYVAGKMSDPVFYPGDDVVLTFESQSILWYSDGHLQQMLTK